MFIETNISSKIGVISSLKTSLQNRQNHRERETSRQNFFHNKENRKTRAKNHGEKQFLHFWFKFLIGDSFIPQKKKQCYHGDVSHQKNVSFICAGRLQVQTWLVPKNISCCVGFVGFISKVSFWSSIAIWCVLKSVSNSR